MCLFFIFFGIFLQRSILPKTRAERFALKDKVSLERNRLNQRSGWQARMHRENAPETSALLTSCPVGAAGYLSNADRFHTDVAGEELAVREEQHRRKLAAQDFRRNMSSKREEDRWSQAEMKKKAEEEYWSKLREDGRKAQKNQSLVAYDILTLQYAENLDGEQQKYYDDVIRYRAACRSNKLVEQGDTRYRIYYFFLYNLIALLFYYRVGYNIISGSERPGLKYPPPIEKPPSLQSGYNSARVDRRTN